MYRLTRVFADHTGLNVGFVVRWLLLKYFAYFSQKIGFDIACKLSSMETICLHCQVLFSGKNKNITDLSFAEFALKRVLIRCIFYIFFRYFSVVIRSSTVHAFLYFFC